MSIHLSERQSGWSLSLDGSSVVQCRVDYAFTLVILGPPGEFTLRIERDFVFIASPDAPGETRVGVGASPEEVAPGLRLLHQELVEAVASNSGQLEISLRGGGWLRVLADEDYEAWTLAGPQGLLLVSLPGGDLAVWKPQREVEAH